MEASLVYFYPKHELREEYQRAGIRLFFLDIPETYHFVKAVYRLVKLIRREKPDLLISCLWRADMISRMASWITGTPLVGTLVNDTYSTLARKDKKGWKYQMVYWLDRWTAKIPVHWIANAQALVDSHVKTLGLDSRKITVVYRGRSIPERNVIAPARSGGREEQPACPELDSGNQSFIDQETASPDSVGIAVTGEIRNFISYGRLLERKGFQDVINAFSQVQKEYPDCALTIFGEGPYRKKLELLVQDLGLQDSVFLPGKIPNPMEVLLNGYSPLPNVHCSLLAAHCFLFPSWYEGFSGALVEAMMAGIPIIASDIPMNLEAVEKDKTALIFQTNHSDELAQKMLWAIQNPTQMIEMGKKARESAIRRFDIEKITKEYEQVLLSILDKLKNQ